MVGGTYYGDFLFGDGFFDDSAPIIGTSPTVHVECAFGNSIVDDPNDMIWYDLGETRSFHTKRGKQTRTGRYEAGTATAVLDNRNRFLDSLNVDSPYYSRRVHMVGADSAYISSPQAAPSGGYSSFVVQTRASATNWHTGTKRTLTAMRDATHGWWFGFNTSGELQIEVYFGGSWHTFKTTGVNVDAMLTNTKPYWFAVHYDPNISGNCGAEFYMSSDATPVSRDLGGTKNLSPLLYKQVGVDHSGTGTGTIDSPVSNVIRLGSDPGFAGASFNGYIHGVRVDNSADFTVSTGYGWSGGQKITSTNFSFGPAIGATMWLDPVLTTWTVNGAAAIQADVDFGSYVRPLRPWRIMARDNVTGIERALWTGVVEKWPNTWPIKAGPGRGDAIATIEGSDAFKVMALSTLVSYDQVFAATLPEAWWRFDDPSEGFSEFYRPQGFLFDSGYQDHPLWWRGWPGRDTTTVPNPLTGNGVSIALDQPSMLPTTSRASAFLGVQPKMDNPPTIADVYGGAGGVVMETSFQNEFVEAEALPGFDYNNNGPRTDLIRDWLPQGNGEFAFAGWIKPDLRGINNVSPILPPTFPANNGSHLYGTIFWCPWAGADGGVYTGYGTQYYEYPVPPAWLGFAGRIWIYMDHNTGKLNFFIRDGTNGGPFGDPNLAPNYVVSVHAQSTTVLAPGYNSGNAGPATQPYFFVCQRRADGTGEIWINGVKESEDLTAAPVAQMATTGLYVGDVFPRGEQAIGGQYLHYMGGAQDFAFWPDRVLQVEEINDIMKYSQFQTGTTTKPKQRVNGILDSMGWPESARSFHSGGSGSVDGTANVTAHDFKDDVLTSLYKFADAEDAEFFMGPDNYIEWYQRTYLRDNLIPLKMTLGDQGSEIHYQDLQFLSEDAQIINQTTVQRTGATNTTLVARDVGSTKEFGIHTFAKTVPLASRSEAQSLAEEFVRRNSKPVTRINSVTVHPAYDPLVMWPLFLSINLLDKVRVLRTPPGGGARLDIMAYVIGIEITAKASSPQDWEFKLVLMNADAYLNTWVLGSSLLGSTTTLAY